MSWKRIFCLFGFHEWSWWHKHYDPKTFDTVKPKFRYCLRPGCKVEQFFKRKP